MASGRVSKVKGKIVDIPTPPTIGTATAGPVSISIAFTAPTQGGPIRSYIAKSNPSNITVTGSTSPINVIGLAGETYYTISVAGVNENGTSEYSSASASTLTEAFAPRGVFSGGYGVGSVDQNVIEYVTITTTGNAIDFGDLTLARRALAACGSSTRGCIGGGYKDSPAGSKNEIDYITIATTGNAIDFGDLTVGRHDISSGSNSTRGFWSGGNGPSNVIDYITIATTGNATDFGDLTGVGLNSPTSFASPTRGIIGGGARVGAVDIIEYITIASTGNATDFGDLTVARYAFGGCSSSTRGLFGGGTTGANSNVIDYITIATTGNATDFGDLSVTRSNVTASVSDSTKGLWAGGYDATAESNVIDYVTIASTGNATDFGDLTASKYAVAGCSNGHGGL